MADDTLDLETLDQDIENSNKVEKRIKDLSEKVRLTSEERDEQKRLLKEQMDKNSSLEKERDFLSSFGDAVAKYPKASSHKDEIKEKVLKGYSVEDAMITTLASKGEFSQKEVKVDNPAGGSAAVNPPPAGGVKPISQMSREEKRTALLEAEEKGDIYIS